MFAILKQSMDSSPVSRCSANVPSPPSLVKHIRTEFDHEATSKTNSIGMIEISGQDASILEARNSPSDSEMLKQRLEIFWKDLKQHLGTSIVQDKENGAIDNLAAVNAKEQEATPKVIAHVDKSPQIVLQPTGLPSHAMGFTPDHIAKEALFRTSLLSKQSQSGVRDYIPNKDLGVLLPPPPKLATPYISATSTSTPFPQPVSCTVADGKPSSTSKKANFHTDEMSTKIKCNTTVTLCDPRAEMPLDLSIQAAGKKRHHDAILNCTTSRRRNEEKAVDSEQTDDQHDDDAALASVRSNFPSLTRYRNQVTTDKKMTLSAHIKNGLSNDTPAPHMGPFTSFYQDPESYATASGRTVSEVVQGSVPPLQLQQWLLAALSAQKWQQMALNQISLLQQQQQLIGDADPPKKRQKHDVGNQQPLSQLFQPSINQQQPGILFSQLNKNNSHSQSNKPDSFPTSHLRVLKDSSPNISPDSTQNQSGKRYRRYAKPPYSYVSLITLSILSSRSKKLRLSQILKRISEMFPFFNGSYQGWRDSVRHNLSQNECFVKVLKNPYRPTAKGNFWTVNLSSIPHELLLRQNTLVSRYAQDSGYRYRKDLSEVFDLRTGALKVSLPLHLVKDANEQSSSPLSNDPAAVMEAILLEETTDDQVNDYKDKISPAVRQFTLEDLFIQTDDGEDESTASNRIRCRNKSSTLSGHAPTFVQKSYANTVYQHNIESLSNSNGTAVTSSSSALDTPNNLELPPVLLPQTSDSRVQLPMALAGSAPNPFAASQTALLSKALAATQVLDSSFSLHKMLHTNQLLQNSLFAAASIPVVPQLTKQPPALSPVKKLRTPSPTIYQRDCHTSNQDMVADISSTSKRNKRKGVLPVRHTTSDYHTINGDSNNVPAGNAIESKEADCESPDCDTMERKVSSEAGSSSSHNFSSPITSSSGKSLLVSSPRHDESSEFEDSRQTIYEADPGTIIGVSRLQSLQVCGTPVAGNGDTMRPI